MKINDITGSLIQMAPLAFQEDYDNSGLLVGNAHAETKGCLVCLDVNEAVIREAVEKNCSLVISHHPIIFRGLNKLTGSTAAERTIMSAIRNDVAIMAMHTNLDNAQGGVNSMLARRLNIFNGRVLKMRRGLLKKLVTFCPTDHADAVRAALFSAGAGKIGQYDHCSFNAEGLGSFRAGDQAHPFAGERGSDHFEPEIRIETIFPAYLEKEIILALLAAHPYEEVAYDIYPLENDWASVGAGLIGETEHEFTEEDFMSMVKDALRVPVVRHSGLRGKNVKKIAVCGGSGSFLIQEAIRQGADALITADLKYHQFQEAEGKILLIDAGHYETEQFTCDLIAGYLKEKFPTFAVLISETPVNPVHYY